jgi:hypothetical protein
MWRAMQRARWRSGWRMIPLLLALGAGTSGCAKKVLVDGAVEEPVPTGPFTVNLTVANQGYFDVNVYLLRTGNAVGRRLGTVNGNSSRNFSFSDIELQPGGRLQVNARAIGSRAAWSSPILAISPGDVAKLILVSGSNGELSRSQFFLNSGD